MKKWMYVTKTLLMIFIPLLAVILSAVGVKPVYAATTWTVTSIADGTAAPSNCPHASNCRLRDAVAAAVAGDTITFANGLSGQVIRLASTINLNKDVTIDGSTLTSQITISGDTDDDGTGNVRIFYVQSINGVTATLKNLKIERGINGVDGGGIYNAGTLTIRNSTLAYNTANWNGGAIINHSILTVIDSTFIDNAAGWGGAISNSATLTVRNSTFSGNHAGSTGGAIDGNATITNSTFYGNYADFGGGVNGSSLTIKNSTFSGNIATNGNGAGVYNTAGTINFSNNIIANSTGEDCHYAGTFITNTNNLVEDGSCGATLNGDPKLGTLANNGGSTQTMALMAGSAAINSGNATTCSASPVSNLDQRGVTRTIGGQCDIGAYESPFSSLTYTSTGAQDGWVLESSETGNTGLTLNSTNSILFIGDDAVKKQYRSILSFNTSGLPDTAVIASVLLKLKQHSIVGGGNPVSFLQGFMAEVKTGMFGTAPLEAADFQTAATATYGPFVLAPVNSWYGINLSNAKTRINKLASGGGLTQIRLRFKTDDNNNNIANYISFFSGNAAAASKPQLVIHYYVP